MTSIYSYQKYIDEHRTVELVLPSDDGEPVGVELATIEGTTYVSVPSGLVLPEQPSEIAASVQQVALGDELKSEIRKVSTHAQLIDARVVERIRSKYTENDELKFARLGWMLAAGKIDESEVDLDELEAFNAHVEAARNWGRTERAKLGLL